MERCKSNMLVHRYAVHSQLFVHYRKQFAHKHTYEFHMMAYTMNESDDREQYLVYPYDTVELKALFIYSSDFKRETNIFFVPKSVQIVAIMVLSFIFVATISLYIMRRKLRLVRNDFSSALFDCWIPFIWGGNLWLEHRLERCFFAILLFGAFFIMSVFSGDLLDCVVRVLNAKINTFAELAEINPPIYSPYELFLHRDMINKSLK